MSCWYCDPPEPTPYCAFCRADCTRQQPCSCCHHRGFPQPHRLAQDVLAAYERRIPGVREARHTDVTAHHTFELLEHLLAVMDAAMCDEDVPARTRHRVMNQVAYASITPPDVIDRERRSHETLMAQASMPKPFTFADLGLPPPDPGQPNPATPPTPPGGCDG